MLQTRRQPRRTGDQTDVQKSRCYRRQGEVAVSIQHRAGHRRQCDEQQIREGDAQHVGGELELARIVGKTWRKQQHNQRRGKNAQQRQKTEETSQSAGDIGNQLTHILLCALMPGFRQHRHEGLGERPFGKQAAHEIGNFERHQKGVHARRSPEQYGQHHVAHEAQHTGNQRHTADNRTRLNQRARHQDRNLRGRKGEIITPIDSAIHFSIIRGLHSL